MHSIPILIITTLLISSQLYATNNCPPSPAPAIPQSLNHPDYIIATANHKNLNTALKQAHMNAWYKISNTSHTEILTNLQSTSPPPHLTQVAVDQAVHAVFAWALPPRYIKRHYSKVCDTYHVWLGVRSQNIISILSHKRHFLELIFLTLHGYTEQVYAELKWLSHWQNELKSLKHPTKIFKAADNILSKSEPTNNIAKPAILLLKRILKDTQSITLQLYKTRISEDFYKTRQIATQLTEQLQLSINLVNHLNSNQLQEAFKITENIAPKYDALKFFLKYHFYQNGIGVSKNQEQASYWLNFAALSGETMAYAPMADVLATGRGIKKSPEQAMHYIQLGFDNHDLSVIEVLGYLLAQDYLDRNQKSLALHILKKAYDSEHANAAYYIGRYYYDNNIQEQRNQAIIWLRKAQNLGSVESQKYLQSLEEKYEKILPTPPQEK